MTTYAFGRNDGLLRSLVATDMLVAVFGHAEPGAIWFYKPIQNSLRPSLDMPSATFHSEFHECIRGAPRTRVETSALAGVWVDGVHVWCDPRVLAPVNSGDDQRYVGRGSVMLDIRADQVGAESTIYRLTQERWYRPVG